jgi:hypothetical protein
MLSAEQAEIPASEGWPTLRILRPVTDLPANYLGQLLAEAEKYGIKRNHIYSYLNGNSHVPLISPGEIINLHQALDITPTDDSVGDLADYLDEVLPKTFDQELLISLRSLKRVQITLKQGSRHEYRATLFRSDIKPRLIQERSVAMEALYRYFNVTDPSTLDQDRIWINKNPGRILTVRLSGSDSNIGRLYRLMAETNVIPKLLTLGPVKIEDFLAAD